MSLETGGKPRSRRKTPYTIADNYRYMGIREEVTIEIIENAVNLVCEIFWNHASETIIALVEDGYLGR